MAKSGRPKKRENDPTLKADTLAVKWAVRVWGGSRRDLSDALRQRGVDYNAGSVHDLVRGNSKSTYQSVLAAIAEVTLGSGDHFTELLASDEAQRPTLLAAMAKHYRDFRQAILQDMVDLGDQSRLTHGGVPCGAKRLRQSTPEGLIMEAEAYERVGLTMPAARLRRAAETIKALHNQVAIVRPYTVKPDKTTTGGDCYVAWYDDQPEIVAQGSSEVEAIVTLWMVDAKVGAND